jgi:hypothetical protein
MPDVGRQRSTVIGSSRGGRNLRRGSRSHQFGVPGVGKQGFAADLLAGDGLAGAVLRDQFQRRSNLSALPECYVCVIHPSCPRVDLVKSLG